jgi:uncharacterized protein YutE (UPF0331/DUF86 family)
MRIDIIKTKLKIIEENIDLVKENFPDEMEEFKKLGLIKDGIYKRIEASIQEIINICSIINTDLKIGIPSNRDEIISALEEKEVISKELGEKIKQLKGFRNFLVHRYGRIQDEIAYEDIKKGFDDFILFKIEIIKFLTSLEREDNNQTKV